MSVTTYTTVNGQILSQSKDGVVSHFVSDPLGSVVMVRDTSGNTVYEAEYDPYGNVQSETGTNPSEFGYVGTLGYVKDSVFSLYVRARYLLTNLGRWLTKDPLWPSEPGFVYAGAMPNKLTDPAGTKPTVLGCGPDAEAWVQKICSMIRNGISDPTRSHRINKCIRGLSNQAGVQCPEMSPGHQSCLADFCQSGRIDCHPVDGVIGMDGVSGLYVCPGHVLITPGGSPLIIPGGISADGYFRPITGRYGGKGERVRYDRLALTLIHEIAHNCNVWHGDESDEFRSRQCNDIWAFCIYNFIWGRGIK